MTTPTPTRRSRSLYVLMPLWVVAALAAAQAGATQLSDPAGDALLRRTDSGANGEVPATAVLPDLTNVTLRGWTMTTPGGDPFVGSPVAGAAGLLRIDVEFAGLLNPPGPNSTGQTRNPFLFGPSPLYGFFEVDVDADVDTGGEPPSAARFRLLANVGRFAARPMGPAGERILEWGNDRDTDFFTAPFVERSGGDFALSFCGCFTPTIDSGDDGDGIFEANEIWKLSGRFFPRAAGYVDASGMSGGSAIGMYDPVVTIRWSYSASSNRTTVSLVYPLTQAGAAMMTNQAEQPIDFRCDNHFSVQEALEDLIVHAQQGLSGQAAVLAARWSKKSAADYLVPANYGLTAIVGTTYAGTGEALYAWTDVAFGLPRGDVSGDGLMNGADAQAIAKFMGGGSSVPVEGMGLNFSIYDVNYDGAVDVADLEFYPTFCPADWDTNGVVNSTDVSLFLNDWFGDLLNGGTVTDQDSNGVVNSTDVSLYVNTWFNDVLGCSP